MLTPEKIEILANYIHKEITELHADPFPAKRWNKIAGQWLVYGFERRIGFLNAVALESAIENAWTKKQCVKSAAIKFFQDFTQ